MKNYLTYGEEWRHGLHADLYLKMRESSPYWSEHGHDSLRETIDLVLLIVVFFLEML